MSRDSSRLDRVRGHVAIALGLVVLAGLAATPATAQPDPAATVGPFDDVSTYRVDGYRTYIQPGAAPSESPGLVWTRKLGDEIHFNPVLLDGTLFVGDYSGVLHALDPATGSPRWTYQAEGPIDGATVVDATVVFSDGGRLQALDAASGELRWVADGGYITSLGPPIDEGVVYWGTEDGVIHGHDLQTGTEVWSAVLPASAPSITIADGTVFAGTSDGTVHAVSLADGSEVWRPIHLLSDRPSSMPVADGVLYVASNQPPGEPVGELLAVDAESGEIRWRFRSPSGMQVTPGAIRDGVLYVASEVDGLYAFDAATGDVLWRAEAPFSGPPITLAGDVLLTPDGDTGELVGLAANGGAELWRVALGGGANTGPIASGGLVFQADDRGNVWAYGGATSGQELASAAEPDAVADAGLDVFEHVDTWDSTKIEGLDHPAGADMGPDGLYYLVNAHGNEVIVLDSDGSVVRRWGEAGTAEGQFDFRRDLSDPFADFGAVAVAPDGSVYVADTANHRIQRFTAEGEFLGQFGSYGSGDGQFLEGLELDIGPDGSVFVVDDIRDDIQRFSPEGTYLETIGRHGSGDGEMAFTGGIVVADDGTLLNADWDNNRVQAWDAQGAFLWTFGERGSDLGTLRSPADVAVDEAGRIFVSDFENGRVQAFDAQGEPLGEWVIPPDELSWSSSVTYGGDGRLYLNNQFGDRIHVLQYVGA